MDGFSSSGVTEMVSLARVGLSFSTVVFTLLGSPVIERWSLGKNAAWSGRQDSNLRPPAPKAGALAKLSYAPGSQPQPARSVNRDANEPVRGERPHASLLHDRLSPRAGRSPRETCITMSWCPLAAGTGM